MLLQDRMGGGESCVLESLPTIERKAESERRAMMKIFKKYLSILCLLCMILSIASPAFALGLERTDFTQDELNEINRTNQLIEDFLLTRVPTRSSDSRVLPMTVIQQEEDYYCGPATACMVAETLGLGSYTQCKMACILKTTEDGSSSDNIAIGLNELLEEAGKTGRYQKTSTTYSNLTDSILYSIQNGFPVVVNVKEMPEYEVSVGHFVAVNGYYVAFSGSSYTSDVFLCDPHPEYFGSYQYDMSVIVDACNSAVGNFCRLAQ